MSITDSPQTTKHSATPYAAHTSAPATSADVKVTGRRVVANLVDGVLLSAIGGGIFAATGVETATAASSAGTRTMWMVSPAGTVLYMVVVLAYYVLMERFLGRTVGKMVTGIRVVGEATGAAPTWGQAIVRTLLRVVDGIFGYLVAFVAVLSNDKRRRIGDMAAKTLVVRS